jgi:tRNA A37 threonylcarbamoyltransferase TsaD
VHHREQILRLTKLALEQAHLTPKDIDVLAFTKGTVREVLAGLLLVDLLALGLDAVFVTNVFLVHEATKSPVPGL